MIIELTLLACIGVFIFIFNSVAMRRSQVDQCRFHIEALLKRRQEVAREINPELAAELTGPITEWFKLDSETEQQLNALPEPAAEQLADYREHCIHFVLVKSWVSELVLAISETEESEVDLVFHRHNLPDNAFIRNFNLRKNLAD